MLLPRDVPFRRLPVITNLVENSKQVRGPEVFIFCITILLTLVGIVINMSLAVGYVVSVLPGRVIRPMGFANISRVCIELVELITVRSTVLGRGNKELSKSSLLLRFLLARREGRGW